MNQGPEKFAVAADMAVFSLVREKLMLLLIRRGPGAFEGHWALPGGFLRTDETIEECALRELEEESGVANALLERFGVYTAPGRDPRGPTVSIAYLALVRSDDTQLEANTDAVDARWFDPDDLPRLAFDHDTIIRDGLKKLRERSEFGDMVLALMPRTFTMPDLHEAAEQVLSKKLDRRNFRKQFLEFDRVELTGEQRRGAHRPAAVYRRKAD